MNGSSRMSRKFVFSGNRNNKGIAKFVAVAIIAVIIVAVGGVAVYFLYLNPSTSGGIGTSAISLGQSSGTVAAGGSMSVSYTVSLASGTKWGTSLVVANNASLKGEGISVSPSTGAMDPTYTGSLSIAVSPNTAAGSYQITLKATGDDPSASNAVFTLSVTAPSSTTSTTTSSTSSSSSTTTSVTSYASSTTGYGY
jgi:hypothetical protein